MTGFVPNAGQPQTAAGSIGGSIGAAVGGMLSDAAIASTAAGVQKLVDSAKSGGFAISEEGANEYIRVFQDFENVLASMQNAAREAGQSPALGGSDYAATVAAHTRLMADGDAQSYSTALESLGKVVEQARLAFHQAKKNYAQMDEQAKQTFGQAQV
ncbi:hypothetical protein [Amycolatopsis alkalitolerans]|uniref:PE domain-containing protein n=1 Tax=Amycolatopsis alkalitolerans TaxID=2547244 RepID=A0A5C4M355_9PSEU|nr:hypothetical protein [Amycolatopsis alkalitolerans]TNC27441.1 hypothetical protein FG385_10285 [Amycolatopsis alkalitolerans]